MTGRQTTLFWNKKKVTLEAVALLGFFLHQGNIVQPDNVGASGYL